MGQKIEWEYWKNPLGGGPEYAEQGEDDTNIDEQPNIFDSDVDVATSVRPVVPTAGGLIPIQVYGSLSANFNFWMMHTNFDLSARVVNILKRVPGVETCDVVTRYRARIGFAKCFRSAEVKKSIQDSLLPPRAPQQATAPVTRDVKRRDAALSPDVQSKVNLLETQANEMYKHWAIYVIPNGEIAFIHAENEQEYKKHLEVFYQSQELAGGTVLTYDDNRRI